MEIEELKIRVMKDEHLKESFLRWMDQTRILLSDLEDIDCDPGQMLKLLRGALTLNKLKYY
jgi:hypothetical protein